MFLFGELLLEFLSFLSHFNDENDSLNLHTFSTLHELKLFKMVCCKSKTKNKENRHADKFRLLRIFWQNYIHLTSTESSV